MPKINTLRWVIEEAQKHPFIIVSRRGSDDRAAPYALFPSEDYLGPDTSQLVDFCRTLGSKDFRVDGVGSHDSITDDPPVDEWPEDGYLVDATPDTVPLDRTRVSYWAERGRYSLVLWVELPGDDDVELASWIDEAFESAVEDGFLKPGTIVDRGREERKGSELHLSAYEYWKHLNT